MSQIELARPEDAGDVADRMTFEVDGWPVARLHRGESASIPVDPGVHLIQVRLDWLSSAPLHIEVPDGARVTATGSLAADSAGVTSTYISPETALDLHVS
ncbi:hypothetical protein [Actinoplanes sp. GCM10030250]|uniref:hypothetical protein n=1 Tax=Actinoplanes sp. GCM10030250 TaxID=3273376 RepID=UPI00361552F6